MTKGKTQEWGRGVKLLSLVFATLLWLNVVLERQDELQLQTPVLPQYVPADLCVVSPPPERLQVTVSGPRILLLRLLFREVTCGLDVSGAAAGTASFIPQESSFGLEHELKLVRVFPGSVSLTLAKQTPR
jgi:hypothetical protein